ncbi:MAG: type III secretion HpaP family protein [Kiritimatiellae bacterium]|nr:type III secretion HpaP family protein [Kiritimatiellia bacterium]MDW8459457.1 hypothetical protein [Verrucomicrobiota bacterium]
MKCKRRQVEREERKNVQKARRSASEAEEKLREWGIADVEEIPEFPIIKGLTEPHPPPASEQEVQESTPFIPPGARSIPKPEASVVASVKAQPPEVLPNTELHMDWTVGDLAFRFSPKASRINLEHRRTLETATVLLVERKCRSNDVNFVPLSEDSLVFKCGEWQIECDLRGLDQSEFFSFRFLDTGIEIRVPFSKEDR